MLFRSRIGQEIHKGDIIINLGLWSPTIGVVRWLRNLENDDFRSARLGIVSMWLYTPTIYNSVTGKYERVGESMVKTHSTYFNSINGVLKVDYPEELHTKYGFDPRLAEVASVEQDIIRNGK